MTEKPTAQQLQQGIEVELRAGLQTMTEVWEAHACDGSQWPLLLAKLHSLAFALAERTEWLADALADYAKEHPRGQLPPDPWDVPVMVHGHPEAWLSMLTAALEAHVGVDEILRMRHDGQLAGPGPHTLSISHPHGRDSAIVVFTDPQGRTALRAYYGLTREQVNADMTARKLVAAPIPYIPKQSDTFQSITTGSGQQGLYDEYGRYVKP